MIANGKATHYVPTPPPPTCSTACGAKLQMLREKGPEQEFARHERHAEATRRAVRAWGWKSWPTTPKSIPLATAVLLPAGHDADNVRNVILEHFDMSLGTARAKLNGKVFRIGHLGDFNDLTLTGTLAGVEMGLRTRGARR